MRKFSIFFLEIRNGLSLLRRMNRFRSIAMPIKAQIHSKQSDILAVAVAVTVSLFMHQHQTLKTQTGYKLE